MFVEPVKTLHLCLSSTINSSTKLLYGRSADQKERKAV